MLRSCQLVKQSTVYLASIRVTCCYLCFMTGVTSLVYYSEPLIIDYRITWCVNLAWSLYWLIVVVGPGCCLLIGQKSGHVGCLAPCSDVRGQAIWFAFVRDAILNWARTDSLYLVSETGWPEGTLGLTYCKYLYSNRHDHYPHEMKIDFAIISIMTLKCNQNELPGYLPSTIPIIPVCSSAQGRVLLSNSTATKPKWSPM